MSNALPSASHERRRTSAPTTTTASAGRAIVHGVSGRRRRRVAYRKPGLPGCPLSGWEAELRRLCADGNKWDEKIAGLLSSATGQRWTREAVRYWRRRLGLPAQTGVAARRLRWQLKRTNDLNSLQDQRYEAHRLYQSGSGWLEDLAIETRVFADGRLPATMAVYLGALAPREVQVLCILWDAGATSQRRAWTRRELAAALVDGAGSQRRAGGSVRHTRRARSLSANGPGDPLSALLARGLVVRTGRRKVGKSLQTLYALRPGLHPYVPETQRPRSMEQADWNPLELYGRRTPPPAGEGEEAGGGHV